MGGTAAPTRCAQARYRCPVRAGRCARAPLPATLPTRGPAGARLRRPPRLHAHGRRQGSRGQREDCGRTGGRATPRPCRSRRHRPAGAPRARGRQGTCAWGRPVEPQPAAGVCPAVPSPPSSPPHSSRFKTPPHKTPRTAPNPPRRPPPDGGSDGPKMERRDACCRAPTCPHFVVFAPRGRAVLSLSSVLYHTPSCFNSRRARHHHIHAGACRFPNSRARARFVC